MQYKVHIAYGFHVNCYHSYRGDTNDAQGFGSDLRIIRGIIHTLDALNAEGIPVKGTWDSENFFSLERILPTYAPDILEGMKRRVKEHGDENIIMGYSNGALGAMQQNELAASIELAVSNPQGSGLRDIFGSYESIVRPQEVMFTPSQVHTYKKLGVKALCLYYSCVPFDAFKTLIPLLEDEKALNPLAFEYQGEELTVIPTYSNADVCDAGCLRAWVKELHKKQASGVIHNDVFLFINMDADAIFWESLDLPVIGNRLANTDGIRGLVKEVADLEYVVFDTPGGYLKTHQPVGTVRFTQDTADGNFTGYASWAEKPYNRKIWTAIERSRTVEKVKKDEADFLNRIKLLSTTHFGLATPVLNIQRETAANALAGALIQHASDTIGALTVHNTSGTALQCVQLACHAPMPIAIRGNGLQAATLVSMGKGSVFALMRFESVKKTYNINAVALTKTAKKGKPYHTLESGANKMVFSCEKGVVSFSCHGKSIGGDDFLSSYITYGGKRYDFRFERLTNPVICGGNAVRLCGSIRLPGAKEQGAFRFTFFTSEAAEGIFVLTDVKYPYTEEHDAISTENSTLGRYTDMKWKEAVPFGLAFHGKGDVKVIKRNFEDDISAFRTASYGEADVRNRTLDSFNNQLTAGMVGVADREKGLLLGNARSVLSSMAYCPMRLAADGRVTMNPFGTFYGRQRHHHNKSDDRIPLTYTLIAPQGKSLAPAYNGARERALMCLLAFTGVKPESETLHNLLAFADGALVTGTDGILSAYAGENVSVHRVEKQPENATIHSPLLSGIQGNLGKYAVRGAKAVGYIIRKQIGAQK